MSHEYYNIVIGGEGVRRRSNSINAEKITFFSNFVRVSKGLLSTIACKGVRIGPFRHICFREDMDVGTGGRGGTCPHFSKTLAKFSFPAAWLPSS